MAHGVGRHRAGEDWPAKGFGLWPVAAFGVTLSAIHFLEQALSIEGGDEVVQRVTAGETTTTRPDQHEPWSALAVVRLLWVIVSSFIVESLILASAILPAAVFYQWHLRWDLSTWWIRGVLLGAATVPAYLIFAMLLMLVSAHTMQLFRWRTSPDCEMRIADLGRPLMNWARYSISTHIVHALVGTLLKSTPMWTWYLRWNGATIGRRAWINSLDVTDHCLLTLGDDVVIGAGAHVSPHTVERGIVRTGRIILGRGTTVGVNSIVGIGVSTGPNCEIGALSLVPKFRQLDGDTLYVGVPARAVGSGSATDERPQTEADST